MFSLCTDKSCACTLFFVSYNTKSFLVLLTPNHATEFLKQLNNCKNFSSSFLELFLLLTPKHEILNNECNNLRHRSQRVPGSRSRSKTAKDMSGLSGFSARFERFERFERFLSWKNLSNRSNLAEKTAQKPLISCGDI